MRRQRRWSFFKILPHLRLTALDARQRFNLVLGFFDRRGRMRTKGRFPQRVVLLEGTLGALNHDLFEALHSTLLIELAGVTQRVLRNVH
jgi:hypothetical protein